MISAMSKEPHFMHKIVREIVQNALPKNCELKMDKACGGDQRIPLFYDAVNFLIL